MAVHYLKLPKLGVTAMPRQQRLDTREARKRLPTAHNPYWRTVAHGIAIGYRKGPQKAEWYLRRAIGGRYIKRTIGQPDDTLPADGKLVLSWQQAMKAALAHPDDIAAIRHGGMTFADLADEYFAARAARSRSKAAIAMDRQRMMAAAVPDLGSVPIAELSTARLRRWRDELVTEATESAGRQTDDERRERQRKAQATANRNFAIVKAILNFGYQQGYVATKTPWDSIKPFRNVDRPRERFLNLGECRKLMAACSEDFRHLVRAALLTGLRYGELARLRVSDYAEGAILVRASKSDTARRVPLTSEGREFFGAVCEGRKPTDLMLTQASGEDWGRALQSRRMRAACRKAGISPPATFHDLRRTYGSLLVNSGAPMAVISKALGHADQRMTQRVYARLLDSVMQKELQRALPRFAKK